MSGLLRRQTYTGDSQCMSHLIQIEEDPSCHGVMSRLISSLVQGLYQDKPPLPFIPGSEVSGIIMEVGPKVKGLKQGDHVCVTCTLCQS